MKSISKLMAFVFVLAACSKPETPLTIAPVETATTAPAAAPSLAPVPPPVGPVTPSFDCAKAESEAEKLVCANYSLATFDKRLAEIYAAELTKPGASKDLAAMQRGWVKGRDECWKAQDKLQCVTEEYMTRIAYLQINSPGQMAATAVAFNCNDNSKALYMAYYGKLDNSPAVITLGNDQAIIFPQPTGSGTKYGRQGVEFNEHQGKVTVDFYGTKLECTPLPASTNL